jgi:hypothetical protein
MLFGALLSAAMFCFGSFGVGLFIALILLNKLLKSGPKLRMIVKRVPLLSRGNAHQSRHYGFVLALEELF